jgi:hypothetical protein
MPAIAPKFGSKMEWDSSWKNSLRTPPASTPSSPSNFTCRSIVVREQRQAESVVDSNALPGSRREATLARHPSPVRYLKWLLQCRGVLRPELHDRVVHKVTSTNLLTHAVVDGAVNKCKPNSTQQHPKADVGRNRNGAVAP